jgi:hypothetical protein
MAVPKKPQKIYKKTQKICKGTPSILQTPEAATAAARTLSVRFLRARPNRAHLAPRQNPRGISTKGFQCIVSIS